MNSWKLGPSHTSEVGAIWRSSTKLMALVLVAEISQYFIGGTMAESANPVQQNLTILSD